MFEISMIFCLKFIDFPATRLNLSLHQKLLNSAVSLNFMIFSTRRISPIKSKNSKRPNKFLQKVFILAFTASRGYQSRKTPVTVPSSISSPCTLQSRDAFTASWKKFMTQSLTSSKWKASRFHFCSAVETFKVFETWLTYDAWLSQTSTRRWERSGNITLDRKRRPS